jgi:hypothetical protein
MCLLTIAFCTLIARGNCVRNAHNHLSASVPVADVGICQRLGGNSATIPNEPTRAQNACD